MKKICVIFRGENERPSVNMHLNINNFQKYIFNNLKDNNYIFDIIFITYESILLNNLIEKMQPKQVLLYKKNCDTGKYNTGQIDNFNEVNNFILKNLNEYDRFVILRFDIVYNIPICNWNNWYQNGIIIPSKDMSWNQTKFYNDLIFIADKEHIKNFNDAVEYMMKVNILPLQIKLSDHVAMPHHIGQYLYLNNITFYLMYDEIIDARYHPLHKFSRYTGDNDEIFK